MQIEQQIEEVLERLWTLREQSVAAGRRLEGQAFDFDPDVAVSEAQHRNWVALRGERLELTAAGEQRAASVKRYLVEVMYQS